MKSFFKMQSNHKGFSMAEVMVAIAMAGGLALVMAQMMKNSNVQQGQIVAKSDADLIFNKINDVLTNGNACNNTFAFVTTAAQITTMQSTTASAGLVVPTIIDKVNAVIMTASPTTGTKLGKARLDSLHAYGLSLTNNLANLEVSVSYMMDGKTMLAKKRVIPLNVAATASDITNCSSSGGGETGAWQPMSLPALGIYYNSGSVLIGTGTVNNGTAIPSFAMGSNNTVTGQTSAAFGDTNTLASYGSLVTGSSNSSPNTGDFSFVGGQSNTASGWGSFVFGSASSSAAGSNLGVAIGVSAVSSAHYARAIGNNVTSSGQGSMTLGDQGGANLTNSTVDGFAARFNGGYKFYTATAQTDSSLISFANGGNVGFGTQTPSVYAALNGTPRIFEMKNSGVAGDDTNALIMSVMHNVPSYLLGGMFGIAAGSSNARKDVAAFHMTLGPSSTVANPTGELHFLYRDTTDIWWKEAMTVSEKGNVGIGVTAPLGKLVVNGPASGTYVGANNQIITAYSDVSVDGRIGVYSKVVPGPGVGGSSIALEAVNQAVGTGAGYMRAGYFSALQGAAGAGRTYGVQSFAGNGTAGYNYGVWGNVRGTNGGAAIFGTNDAGGADYDVGTTKWAGYFVGPVALNPGSFGINLTLAADNTALFRAGTGVATGYIDLTNIQFRDSASGGSANIGIAGKLGVGNWAAAYPLDVTGDIRTSQCLRYNASTLGACASDKRIKKDIHSFDMGLKELLGINPVYYKHNGLGGLPADTQEQIGVIAQDLEKNVPQLISKQKVKLHKEDLELTEIKTVNYSPFIYMAINSIKELYKKMVALFESDTKQNREIAAIKEENKKLVLELQKQRETQAEMKQMLCAQNPKASFCKN